MTEQEADLVSMDDKTLFYEVAKLAEFDGNSAIFWRYDNGRMRVFAECGDVFAWGCSDVEEITPDNLAMLRQAVADVRTLTTTETLEQRDASDGFTLFCARARGMRPQGAFYKYLEVHIVEPGPPNAEHGYPTWKPNKELAAQRTAALHALFDAAGPERVVDAANPYPQVKP